MSHRQKPDDGTIVLQVSPDKVTIGTKNNCGLVVRAVRNPCTPALMNVFVTAKCGKEVREVELASVRHPHVCNKKTPNGKDQVAFLGVRSEACTIKFYFKS